MLGVLVLTFANAIRTIGICRTVAGNLARHWQWFATVYPVSGIAIVAIAACTLSFVTFRNAFRILATMHISTYVVTFGNAI